MKPEEVMRILEEGDAALNGVRSLEGVVNVLVKLGWALLACFQHLQEENQKLRCEVARLREVTRPLQVFR